MFYEESNGRKTWYAFVERHTVGNIAYELLQLEKSTDLEGKTVSLESLSRFAKLGLKDSSTDLNTLGVFQIDWQKPSRHVTGNSVLKPVWGILQEISEIQTQIRQERIKHFRSKLALPIQAMLRC